MPLRFPQKFEKGLPIATFYPFTYLYPKGDSLTAKSEKKVAPGVETVSLYVPGDYSESMASKWGYQELLGGASSSALEGMWQETANAAKQLAGAKIASKSIAQSGNITMPMDMNIYQGPEPLSVNFKFDMVPVNKAEGDTVVSIIQNFKKSTFPLSSTGQESEDATSIILDYPPVWDIEFNGVKGIMLGDKPAYYDMALTKVDVSFNSGTSNLSVFYDGNPTQVTLNLSFQAIRKYYKI